MSVKTVFVSILLRANFDSSSNSHCHDVDSYDFLSLFLNETFLGNCCTGVGSVPCGWHVDGFSLLLPMKSVCCISNKQFCLLFGHGHFYVEVQKPF